MTITLRDVRKGLRRPDKALSYINSNAPQIFEEALSPRLCWSPFANEWDVLVVLDACRYDLACEASSTDVFGDPERVWSLGAHSPTWIERTFRAATPAQLEKTGYISANPFTDKAPENQLKFVDNVATYAFDTELGTVPPRPLTDRAIQAIRAGRADRYILHYIQPHLPPVDGATSFSDFIAPPDQDRSDANPWRDTEAGENDPEAVTRAYRENLEPVVRDVELLLENIDAETVVITADHGNFLGERGRWGHHYEHSVHPAVRAVPYWELSAVDQQTHAPATYDREADTATRRKRLEALGYR